MSADAGGRLGAKSRRKITNKITSKQGDDERKLRQEAGDVGGRQESTRQRLARARGGRLHKREGASGREQGTAGAGRRAQQEQCGAGRRRRAEQVIERKYSGAGRRCRAEQSVAGARTSTAGADG